MSIGLPRVTCKLAMSLDGRTAMENGESQWITGPEACAIITGIGSILIDDSKLNVRELAIDDSYAMPRQQPLRVVMDSRLCTPLDASVIGNDGRCLVLYSNPDVGNVEDLRQAGARVIRVSGQSQTIDLEAALRYLAEKEQCNEVLIEAGATLSGALLE